MSTPAKLLSIAALAAFAASSGCLYEREAVREPPPVVQSAPPPPTTQPPPPADYDPNVAPPASAEADNVPPPGADVQDDSVFHERLAPYGHWEWVPEYGRVWVPAVAPGWRPYVYGRWVLTDWGWTWVSDDPWAWAAYHYGTWGYTGGIGWFWVPGHVWAPAWVTWRWGFGYCAWAPIGPRGFVWGYTSPAWVAVRAQHFTQPISVHVVSVQSTSVIVQRTAPLASPRAVPTRGGSFGPPVAQVAAATGQTIRPVSAAAVVSPRARFAPTRQNVVGSPARAQSPMQSPRAQPAQSTGTWRGASRATSTGSWRARTSGTTGVARGWGTGTARANARTSAGVPPARVAAPSNGGAPRAAPSAPHTAPSSGRGGGGGAPHASGGHGRR